MLKFICNIYVLGEEKILGEHFSVIPNSVPGTL